MTSYLQK